MQEICSVAPQAPPVPIQKETYHTGDLAKDLILAICLYRKLVTKRNLIYLDCERDIFRALTDTTKYFGYTHVTAYPDICACGVVFNATGSVVRNHCANCKGYIKTIRYEIEKVFLITGFHISWIEMAFATSVWLDSRGNEHDC